MLNVSIDIFFFTLEQRKGMFIAVAKHSAAISRLAWSLKLQSRAACVHSLVCDGISGSGGGLARAGLGICFTCALVQAFLKETRVSGFAVSAIFSYTDNVHISCLCVLI